MINTLSLPVLAAALTFMVLCLAMMAVYHYLQVLQKKKALLSKIRRNSLQWSGGTLETQAGQESVRSLGARLIQAVSLVGRKASRGITEQEYSEGRLRFLRAGIVHPQAMPVFWGVKSILALLLAVIFMGLELHFSFLMNTTWTIGLALSASLLGFYLPDFWLLIKRNKRVNEMERGFPDALDLLVVCVEAGMGLDGAINRVAREISLSHPALSRELHTVTMEIKAGKSREQALQNLGTRTNLDDVKNFTGLMLQTLRFGTSVADTLRVYSDTFRTRRRQKVEEKAAKLPIKMIFPCALFIFPALFVVILGPAVISIFETLMN